MIPLTHTLRRLCATSLATVIVLAAGPAATGSVVVPLSLAQLTAAADLVAEGTVVDVRTVAGPEGIERLVQVRVASNWKGPGDTVIYVRLAGGRLGATETRVPGVPVVADGDVVVWFLAAHPRGGYSVLGLHQGALTAVTAADGTRHVLAPARVASARGDVTRVPRRLDDLEADVRSLAAVEGAR